MTAASVIVAGWLCLGAVGSPEPSPPPEVKTYEAAAMVFFDAGDFASAADLFERAYLAMPDPVLYREWRGAMLGSLRGTLLDLYDQTGDVAHLVRIRDLLVRHREALRAALGASAKLEDTARVDAEIDALGRRLAELLPPLLTREAPARAAARGRRRVGAALLGSSAVPLVAAAVALGVHVDRYRRIENLDRELDDAGRPATASELARVDALGRQSVAARGAAIATASIGGVLLVAGVAVLATGRRSSSRVSVAPLLSPRVWGLGFTGRF